MSFVIDCILIVLCVYLFLRLFKFVPASDNAAKHEEASATPVPVRVYVKTLDPTFKPTLQYQSNGASGIDLESNEETFTLEHNSTKIVRCGIAVEIPIGYEIQIRSRSGLAAKHEIFVLNSPGTIDSDYRGEICVILHNLGKAFQINRYDRIAQMVLTPVVQAEIVRTSILNDTQRGDGKFGSTGI